MSNELKKMREQVDEMYGAASLGLTAEVIVHEFETVIDKLLLLNNRLRQHLKKTGSNDTQLHFHETELRTYLSALRKQLSHLSPSLRYVKEKREVIRLEAFVAGVKEYHDGRFEGSPIVLKTSTKTDFHIRMNRGKVTQVLDNLIFNSEYWLKEDLRLKRLDKGEIRVTIDHPCLRVEDNGRGVEADVETSLFEPFVTTKPRGKGRGLGLFIVRQLLDTEACTVDLLNKRNKHGNRYIFEINFSESVVGSRAHHPIPKRCSNAS